MNQDDLTSADAQLLVADVVTDTLAWVFLDEDDAEYDQRVDDLRNLTDLILTDLGLVVVDVVDATTFRAEIRLVDPEQSDIPDVAD